MTAFGKAERFKAYDANITVGVPQVIHPSTEMMDSGDHVGVGRIRPEAKSFADNNRGTIGNVLSLEGNRILFHPKKPKCKENIFGVLENAASKKDFISENVRRMRQIQRSSRRKQAEQENSRPVPVKALWQSEKWKAVPSKLQELLASSSPPHAPRSESATNFLRAHSRNGPSPALVDQSNSGLRSRSASACGRLTPDKSSSSLDLHMSKDVNYIKLNGKNARYSHQKRPPTVVSEENLRKKKDEDLERYKRECVGRMPLYLIKREQEAQRVAEERKKNAPDPEMPPHHRKLLEKERIETLALLKSSQSKVEVQMARLPLRNDTHKIRQHRQDLEKKSVELEEAIKIFSRPKVFLRLEDNEAEN